MLFNSWEFIALLLIALPLYYLPVFRTNRQVWQVTLLLVASAVFYAWNEPRLLLLLFASCLMNSIAVERILFWKKKGQCFGESAADRPVNRLEATLSNGESARNESKEPSAATGTHIPTEIPKHRNTETPVRKARLWLFWTVALNVGFLAFFKYAVFFANLLPDTLLPVTCKSWLSGIPLPVGISFYTFQGISMVVDVWRDDISKHTRAQLSERGRNRIRSIRDTSFYISFFPQLVAGPIVKAHEFMDQIGAKAFSEIDWLTVRRGLFLGYFLKVFVADNLAEQTVTLTMGAENLANNGPLNLIPLLYGYSLQIFADFAGYSLVAIGLGALFGYKLPPNFNFPYLSTSITEFWRRWHISLSSWLRDYLYFPLGGNRKGSGRTYLNLFLVMFLGGLWHGAAWKFALWGMLHGLFLATERLVSSHQKSETRVQNIPSSGLWSLASGISILKWLATFHLVTILWLTFLMPDLASVLAFFKGMTSGNLYLGGPPIFSLLFYGSAVALYHVWGWIREHREVFALKILRSPLEPLVHGLMFFLILTNPGAPRGFIYFQF